jgi:hypothetical protein
MFGIEVNYKNISSDEEKVIDWICDFRDNIEKNYLDIHTLFLEIHKNLRKVNLDQKILNLYMFHCKDVVQASELFKQNGNWETIYESSGRFIETMIEMSIGKFGYPQTDKDFVRLLIQFQTVIKDGKKHCFYYIGFSTMILFFEISKEKSYSKRVKYINENYFSKKFLEEWNWFLTNLEKPAVKELFFRWSYKIKDENIKKDIFDLLKKIE